MDGRLVCVVAARRERERWSTDEDDEEEEQDGSEDDDEREEREEREAKKKKKKAAAAARKRRAYPAVRCMNTLALACCVCRRASFFVLTQRLDLRTYAAAPKRGKATVEEEPEDGKAAPSRRKRCAYPALTALACSLLHHPRFNHANSTHTPL